MEPIKCKQISFEILEDPKKTEVEKIMEEQREKQAKQLVDDLNKRFFEQVSEGLREGQQMTFRDADGTRFIITQGSVKILDQDDVDFITEGKKHICPNCKRSVDKETQVFNKATLTVLIKAFNHAMKTSQQYIQIQELKLDGHYYGIMNHLIRYGLAFRNKNISVNGKKDGVYGIPRKRIFDFLQGNWTVADSYTTDPTLPKGHKNKRVVSERRITVDQVPSVQNVRDLYGEKFTSYEWNEPDEFTSDDCFE